MKFCASFYTPKPKKPSDYLDHDWAVTAALLRCSKPTQYVLHFCTLKTGRCGWRKGKENRWLHIFIPDEFPVECAFKPSQITSFQSLRQLSAELHEAMPNLRELKVFCGLPNSNPKVLAHIK